MATKKQKRLAGERQQEINRAESERTGLVAQNKDRQHREARFKALAEKKAAEDRKKSSLKDGFTKLTTAMKGVSESSESAARAFERLNEAYLETDDDQFGPVETIELKPFKTA